MRGLLVASVLTALPLLLASACTKHDDCASLATCEPLASGDGGPTASGDGGDGGDAGPVEYPPVPVPANCVVLDDPSSALKCEVDEYALFVDGVAGNDEEAGTQAKPLKTLGKATDREKLRGRRRIYLSDAPQAGNVVLPPGVSLAGGFRATDWGRPEGKTTTITGAVGVDGVAKPTLFFSEAASEDVVLSDLVVTAPKTDGGESSIGLFVAARNVKAYRLDVHAGLAGNGSILPPQTNSRSGTADGKSNATGSNACTCLLYGTTTGGGGGTTGARGTDGTSDPPAKIGTDGKGSEASCSAGSTATNGGDGAGGAGGTALGALGSIDATGWVPTNGLDGLPGEPGGGGGGGGNGGGSGGCGGCGGAGGRGGRAGGSSLGIVGFNCNITLVRTLVTAENAGNGHAGDPGGEGQKGGVGGASTCNGGAGGIGGGGGGGAGGAAGISAAILYVNGEVRADDADTKLTSGENGKNGGSGPVGPRAPTTTGQEGRVGSQGPAAGTKSPTLRL